MKRLLAASMYVNMHIATNVFKTHTFVSSLTKTEHPANPGQNPEGSAQLDWGSIVFLLP